nr:hypothetical protein [Angustibacter aerolatus]
MSKVMTSGGPPQVPQRGPRRGRGGGLRLFVAYAALSLAVVAASGVVLVDGARGDARANAVREGRTQATVIQQMVLAPALRGVVLDDLPTGHLTGTRSTSLRRANEPGAGARDRRPAAGARQPRRGAVRRRRAPALTRRHGRPAVRPGGARCHERPDRGGRCRAGRARGARRRPGVRAEHQPLGRGLRGRPALRGRAARDRGAGAPHGHPTGRVPGAAVDGAGRDLVLHDPAAAPAAGPERLRGPPRPA